MPVNGTAMDLMIRPGDMKKNAMPMKIPLQNHMTRPCHRISRKNPLQTGGVQEA